MDLPPRAIDLGASQIASGLALLVGERHRAVRPPSAVETSIAWSICSMRRLRSARRLAPIRHTEEFGGRMDGKLDRVGNALLRPVSWVQESTHDLVSPQIRINFTDLAKNGSCRRNRTPSLRLFDRSLRSSVRRLRAGRRVSLSAPLPRFLLCQKPVSDHLPNLRNPLRFPLGPPLLGTDLLGAFHFEAVECHPVLLASVLAIL
jgi:hypothetical protein